MTRPCASTSTTAAAATTTTTRSNTAVPFQVAYAVSIHKAQGLEYDSVKVVITDANEDDITHSIFYTAITRARERSEDLLDAGDAASRSEEPPAGNEPQGRLVAP